MDAVEGNPQADNLGVRIETLEWRIAALEAGQRRHEWLTTLAPASLRLTRQIPVSIDYNGDDYVAQFVDAGIGATGDTMVEAIWNLRDTIVLKFNRFSELASDSLGPVPRRQMEVLRSFIEE